MKRVLVFLVVTVLLVNNSQAQVASGSGNTTAPYSSAFGGRIEMNPGTSYIGFTYKHFLDAYKSCEFMALSDFSNGVEFYGFYEYNGIVPDFPSNLRWVVGGGANVGTWSGFNDNLVIGIDGILGVEYTVKEIPLNLGLDWKPLLNLVTSKPDSRFWPSKFGISIRYTMKKASASTKSKK